MNIEERKIIHILLKHLMDLKNETAFLKNKLALNSSDDDLPENKVGTKNVQNGIKEKEDGTNNVNNGIKEKEDGTIHLENGITQKKVGTNNVNNGIKEKEDGTIHLENGITQKEVGANNVNNGIKEKEEGTHCLTEGIKEIKDGTKSVMDGISILGTDGNGGTLLYSVFEKGLKMALEDYIKNGDGQNSLYRFYTHFEEAVEAQNLATAKIKDDASNVRLEDTHELPAEIPVDTASINKFRGVLRPHLQKRNASSVNATVSRELLLLHNAGKATGAELRGFSGLSEAGFKKHLPNLKRYGLVEKQPPLNYVLTDKVNHILLKLFGVAKTI